MSETDAEFLDRMSFTEPEEGMRERDFDRLFALARRGAEATARIERLEAEAKTRALDYLEQLGQLSEELERVKREADRAQDAHGVRFLNYLEETARLADEVERLRSVLEVAADRLFDAGLNDAWADARAALEDKT